MALDRKYKAAKLKELWAIKKESSQKISMTIYKPSRAETLWRL